jgi:PIN domain nuclease of toxin-antitoxin system
VAVLDASALLAYLRSEPGAEVIVVALAEGAAISAVNLAEVLTKLADAGARPEQATAGLRSRGILGGALALEPFTEADALASAALRSATARSGLSLGDRACLALGRRLGQVVLTTDHAWKGLDTGVEVQLIR